MKITNHLYANHSWQLGVRRVSPRVNEKCKLLFKKWYGKVLFAQRSLDAAAIRYESSIPSWGLGVPTSPNNLMSRKLFVNVYFIA